MTSPLQLRPAVRGLVIDEHNRILMVRLVFNGRGFWVLPGGGIDPHEDIHTALHRELAEETGLVNAQIGPAVWQRTHHFQLIDTDGYEWAGQSEVVHLVRTTHFEPTPLFTSEQLLAENLHEHRWWTLDEILQYDGVDRFTPRDIGVHLQHLHLHGVPDVPFIVTEID